MGLHFKCWSKRHDNTERFGIVVNKCSVDSLHFLWAVSGAGNWCGDVVGFLWVRGAACIYTFIVGA